MSAHTPGPWHVSRAPLSGGGSRAERIVSESGDLICEGLNWNNNGEVDGYLLAAAPELLAAIINIRNHGGFQNIAELGAMDALIARATGKDTL